MRFLSFDEIKKQLRLDDEQAAEEREILEVYGKAAEDAVLNITRRTMTNVIMTYGGVPSSLRHAALLLTALSYKQREAASEHNLSAVPYSIDLLLKPYMRLSGEELPVEDDDLPDGDWRIVVARASE